MQCYTDPRALSQLIKDRSLKMSKGMGQNFLIDPSVPERIVEMSGIGADDCVIEVGPGAGALTCELSRRAKRVTAIELDKNLIPILKELLKGEKNVEIINADVLNVDLDKVVEGMGAQTAKLCANLPYNVATSIITGVLESSTRVTELTVMVQREVASRICASPGSKDYGVLSVVCEYYCGREVLFDVDPDSFMPRPKVVSTVVKLNRRKVPSVQVPAQKLFKFVNLAFSQRRKTIQNCLSSGGRYDKEDVKNALEIIGIRPDARAEMLSIEEFSRLLERLEQNDSMASI